MRREQNRVITTLTPLIFNLAVATLSIVLPAVLADTFWQETSRTPDGPFGLAGHSTS